MVHSVMGEGAFSAQAFTILGDSMEPLGTITSQTPLELDGYTVALGELRRYTGLSVYNRPHGPWLLAGCLAMLFGLVWHFYFRYRDRRNERGGGPDVA
jgi:hypothetical protein